MTEEMDVTPTSPRGTKRKGDDTLPLPAPRRIKALSQDVVNKIAAGEIIVAPVHALKELIENAVDAGSTALEVVIKDGGLKLLQITDNGHGIDVRARFDSNVTKTKQSTERGPADTLRTLHNFQIESFRGPHLDWHVRVSWRSSGKHQPHRTSKRHYQDERVELCLACELCRWKTGEPETWAECGSEAYRWTTRHADHSKRSGESERSVYLTGSGGGFVL
jgi:hypothetical protein